MNEGLISPRFTECARRSSERGRFDFAHNATGLYQSVLHRPSSMGYLQHVLDQRFRHPTVPGPRGARSPALLQERTERMDEVMRQVHASPRFSFAAACEAVAEGTQKARANAR